MNSPPYNSVHKGRPIRRRDRIGYMIKVRVTPPVGRTKVVSVYGATLAAVEENADRVVRWYAQFSSIDAAEAAKRQTVATCAETYIADRPIAPKTVAGYEWLLRPDGPVAPILHQRVADITTDAINAWSANLARAGYSPSMQRRAVKLVKAILRTAQSDGLLPHVRLDRIRIPTQSDTIMRYWLPQEARQFLAAVDGRPEAVAYVLMVGMGLRVGEVRGLLWRDLDLQRGMLHIRQQVTDVGGVPTITTPKSQKSRRTLPIPGEFKIRLAQHLEETKHERGRVRPTDYVVATKSGEPYTRERIAYVLTQVARAAGLPEIHIHGMRHTYAAIMRHHGTDIATLSRLMGHSDLRTTQQYYGHLYDDDLRRANEPMGRLLAPEEEL